MNESEERDQSHELPPTPLRRRVFEVIAGVLFICAGIGLFVAGLIEVEQYSPDDGAATTGTTAWFVGIAMISLFIAGVGAVMITARIKHWRT